MKWDGLERKSWFAVGQWPKVSISLALVLAAAVSQGHAETEDSAAPSSVRSVSAANVFSAQDQQWIAQVKALKPPVFRADDPPIRYFRGIQVDRVSDLRLEVKAYRPGEDDVWAASELYVAAEFGVDLNWDKPPRSGFKEQRWARGVVLELKVPVSFIQKNRPGAPLRASSFVDSEGKSNIGPYIWRIGLITVDRHEFLKTMPPYTKDVEDPGLIGVIHKLEKSGALTDSRVKIIKARWSRKQYEALRALYLSTLFRESLSLKDASIIRWIPIRQ